MKEIILHTPKNIAFVKDIVKYLPQAIRRRLPVEIAVVPVSAKESASLNSRYRKKRTPANVLSFLYPVLSPVPWSRLARHQKLAYHSQQWVHLGKGGVNAPEYGEIIVCPSIIRREARAQGHTYKYQMTWMIVHGTIHLSGLHHEQSRTAAKRVENLEQKILHTVFKKKILN